MNKNLWENFEIQVLLFFSSLCIAILPQRHLKNTFELYWISPSVFSIHLSLDDSFTQSVEMQWLWPLSYTTCNQYYSLLAISKQKKHGLPLVFFYSQHIPLLHHPSTAHSLRSESRSCHEVWFSCFSPLTETLQWTKVNKILKETL